MSRFWRPTRRNSSVVRPTPTTNIMAKTSAGTAIASTFDTFSRFPPLSYPADARVSLERVDTPPVVLHADDGPAAGGGLVEGFVQAADEGVAVVGPLALRVGVVDQAHE